MNLSDPITLEENGVVIHTALTEEAMWSWIAVNLPEAKFFEVEQELLS